jgi:hypothetical protein
MWPAIGVTGKGGGGAKCVWGTLRWSQEGEDWFEQSLTGRSEMSLAAPTPCRLQLSSAGKLSGHYKNYRAVQHEINVHSMMDIR